MQPTRVDGKKRVWIVVFTLVLALGGMAVSPYGTAGGAEESLGASGSEPAWTGPVQLGESSLAAAPQSDMASDGRVVVRLEPGTLEPGDVRFVTTIRWSDDALVWQAAETIEGVRLTDVAVGGPGFVAVGSRHIGDLVLEPAVWTSEDGRSWSPVEIVGEATGATVDPIPFTGAWMTRVAAGEGDLFAVGHIGNVDGAGRAAVWRSVDGLNWTLLPSVLPGRGTAVLDRVAAGPGGLVVLGEVPTEADEPGPLRLWWSADGDEWIAAGADSELGPGLFVRALAGYGPGFVMVGFGSTMGPMAWTSADGRSWAGPVALPTRPDTSSSFVDDVLVRGSLLVAVGDDFASGVLDASIWTSADGVVWKQVPPESLRGAVTLDASAADHVVHHADRIVVYGSTWSHDDEPARRLAWFGRTGRFIDVPESHRFFADVEWLASEGITKGCNPPVNDRFCPDDMVTRGQMAAFLVRALGYVDDGGGDLFVDDDGSVFEGDIDRLGAAGVTKGCNPPVNDRFCPDDMVTRAQMAAFLHRALG